MIKVWRLLSILIIPLMCLGLMLVPAVPTALAASPDWGYEITPNITAVGFNTDFNVTVSAVCYAENADSWNIMVDFDPTYLQVINITRPATLPNGDTPDPYPSSPVLNNTTGWVFDGYGVQPAFPPHSVNVTFNAWTIHFRSNNVTTGGTYLNFITIDPFSSTMVILVGEDWLNWTEVVNGTVKIGSPTLTVNVSPAGKGDVNISGVTPSSYPNTTNRSWDAVVNLTAVNSVPNWTFDHWSGDLSGSANPTNITMDGNKNVTANFVRYYLNVTNSTGGTVTAPGVGTFGYGEAENVTLVATNYTGYHFANWTGGVSTIGDVNASSTFINMTGNYSICATFAINRYNLTINSTIGGNVTIPGEGTFGPYDHGTVVNLTATPDTNYTFVAWSGNVSTIAYVNSSNTNITMYGNYSIMANFALKQYNLTINSTIGGNVTIPGEGTFGPYDHGTVVNLTATPDADYAFLWWSGNVSTIGDVNSSNTSITMYGNYSIIANFGPHYLSASPIPLTFTATEGENPPAQTLEVCNTGNGTLNWTLTDNAGWLSESPVSGSLNVTECENVTVSVAASSLAAGDYSATITITGSLELEVPVSLSIAAAAAGIPGAPGGTLAPPVEPAQLSASGLSISPQQVNPGQEVTISINVKNSGEETGSYNAVLYINGAVETSQSVSVAGGMTKNVIFKVTKSDAGVYDVSIAGQSGQFEVVHTGWFGGGLGTGGIVAIVVIVIVLILALVFVLRGTRRAV